MAFLISILFHRLWFAAVAAAWAAFHVARLLYAGLAAPSVDVALAQALAATAAWPPRAVDLRR